MKRLLILVCLPILTACAQKADEVDNSIPKAKDKKSYWYGGEAEISSYELKQARYGEIHEGKSVLVFVTEPFSPSRNTKADNNYPDNVSVMKLNNTRKFNTGIYPYSIMTSTFVPFENPTSSIKISNSSQEWCGHTFMDLKKDSGNFNINVDSYFEGESKENIQLATNGYLEDDVWTMIRLNPKGLPIGDFNMLPSFTALRLLHLPTTYETCTGELVEDKETSTYTVTYPKLQRSLSITFQNKLPYVIESWEETNYSGWGAKRKQLTTTGKRIKTIKSAYWQKNSTSDSNLRKELGLD